MADGNYQVIFSGRLIEGADLDMVKRNVAKLFKLDDAGIEKLFCGRRLILKKQIDQVTAEKYQATMQRAGAICEIENTDAAQKVSTAPVTASAAEVTPTPQHETQSTDDVVSLAEPGVDLIKHEVVPDANIDTGTMDMADVGIQLGEHEVVPDANIDTGTMDMAEVGIQLGEHEKQPDAEFDTSGMSLDDAGAQLVESKEIPEANIDTSHLSAE